jgi:hypothetical protein
MAGGNFGRSPIKDARTAGVKRQSVVNEALSTAPHSQK